MFSTIAFNFRIDVTLIDVNGSVLVLGWVGLLMPTVNTLNNHSMVSTIAINLV